MMIRTSILFCIPLMLIGCATRPFTGFPQTGPAEYTFPAPPEPARVAWVGEIRSHEDLYQISGGFAGLGRIIGGPPDSEIARPFAVAVHPDGLLVADPGRSGVHFFDWANNKYRLIGEDHEDELPSPVGVAVIDRDILVSDSRLNQVIRFKPNGDFAGIFADGFGRPAGIAVSAEPEIFVADVTEHQIKVFDAEGSLLRTFGERGPGTGVFNYPTHIAIGPDGLLYVTDSMNFRIQILRLDGTYVSDFGSLGASPGSFSKPKGLAVDEDGNIAVIEGLYDALQFFNDSGELLMSIGRPGSGPAEFWLPAGLGIDRTEGLLFVADSYNSRIQVFRFLRDQAPLSQRSPDEAGREGAAK